MKIDNENLLEFIQYIVGCEYLSDLRSDIYNDKAILLLQQLDLTQYSFNSVIDAIEYLSQTQNYK